MAHQQHDVGKEWDGPPVPASAPAHEPFGEEFWDERYRSHHSLWSGDPNVHLVGETSELTPGAALDVGCGEGADVIWLAGRGWRVTAIDLSQVALQRGAATAERAGAEVAARITWIHADLTTWDAEPGAYDLVSAQYVHLPSGEREGLVERLAAAVAPGGSLLIGAHHPSDLETTMRRPRRPDLYFTGDDLAAQLDADSWDVVTNAAPSRSARDPEGRTVSIRDTVFRARRRPSTPPGGGPPERGRR